MRTVLRLPASPGQLRLWAIERTSAGEPLHNINMEVLFDVVLDPELVRVVVTDLMARHEALRTGFEMAEGVLQQYVLEPGTVPQIELVDLSDSTPAIARQRYQAARDELARITFDLADPPLLRVGHYRLADPAVPSGVHDALVLVVHHIVTDARSSHIMVADLDRALVARRRGEAPDWVPVPVQYADYTAWRASLAGSPQTLADLDYWRAQLAGVAELDLTLGRPRPAEPSYSGGSLPVATDAALTARIERLARQERTTRFAVLLAAWAAALGAVFGATDIPVGTSVSTRERPELADTIGFFVDRLVLRLSLAGRPSFRVLISRARDTVLAAYDHNRAGFDQIVDALAPARQYGVTPLAQVSINLQPRRSGRADLGTGMSGGGGQFDNGTVAHDLALDLADRDTSIGGWLKYRRDVVAGPAAERLCALFLDVLAATPDTAVGELTALPAAELARLHAEQDGGPIPGDRPATLRVLVDRWVAATPDAIAVDGPGGRLSYAGFADQVDRLGARLAAAGVRPDDSVLVAVPRRVELPVCLLGVQAAGAVPVPVDAAAPAAHLAAVAAASGATFALAAPGAVVQLPASVTVLPVELAGDDPGPTPAPAIPAVRAPADSAYLLFTSGSTGRPKGVVVEHRQLVAYTLGVLRLLAPPPGAVHLMVQAPTFDSSWTTVAGALASGGVLRLVDEDAARDPHELARLLTGAPADYLKITPSHLAALLGGMDAELLRPRRALVLGGESERLAVVDRLRELGWRVFGHYGPTETTVGVLAHELTEGTGAGCATVPLGAPLPGVRVYLLDPDLRPVPPGCQGQLFVGGALVARGYVAAPGPTAAAFLPDPFGQPGARMYRTGDLARRLPDGTFEFGGRADRQVKLSGNRLELTSVEAVLERQPAVARAAAVVRGPKGQERLVAYVVPAPAARPTPAELTAAVAGVLPTFAVPGAFVILDELPMNAAGKLDVAALPDPVSRGDDGLVAAPENPAEQQLSVLWRTVLPDADVLVTARFFDIGGDSIRAIELVSAARSGGIPLSVKALFDHQTIRAVARSLADEHDWPDRDPAVDPSGAGPTLLWLPVPAEPDRMAATGRVLAGTGITAAWPSGGLLLSIPPGRPGDAELGPLLTALAPAFDSELSCPPPEPGAAILAVAALSPTTAEACCGTPDGYDPDLAALAAAAVAVPDPAAEPAAGPAPQIRAIGLPAGARLVDLGAPPGVPVLAVTGHAVVATGPDAARRAGAVRAELEALVAHRTACPPTYSADDFPDADLDDATLALLLDRMGLAEDRPEDRP